MRLSFGADAQPLIETRTQQRSIILGRSRCIFLLRPKNSTTNVPQRHVFGLESNVEPYSSPLSSRGGALHTRRQLSTTVIDVYRMYSIAPLTRTYLLSSSVSLVLPHFPSCSNQSRQACSQGTSIISTPRSMSGTGRKMVVAQRCNKGSFSERSLAEGWCKYE